MNVPSVGADYTRVAIDFKVKSRKGWAYSVFIWIMLEFQKTHCIIKVVYIFYDI